MRLTKYVRKNISRFIKATTNRLSSNYKKNIVHGAGVARGALSGVKTEIMRNSQIDKLSEVGSYCYIGQSVHITKTKIGHYCSIANNVSIGQGEHLINEISTHSMFYKDAHKILTAKSCVIENDVWIGVDAIILRGVHIGNGAIIGANSVVTKDVPSFAVVAGSPARIIKYRFDDATQQKILESNWWDRSPAEATKIFGELKK